MKILAMEQEQEGVTADQFRPWLKAEAAALWQLCQAGVVRECHFRADRHCAVLVLECEDIPAAAAALERLPLVEQRLIRFELIPLVPYPGFARLFAAGPDGRGAD